MAGGQRDMAKPNNRFLWGAPPIETFEAVRMCSLRWQGWTYEAIAVETGRSENGVKRVCRQFGIDKLERIPEWCARYGGSQWKSWAHSGCERAKPERPTCPEPSTGNGSSSSKTRSRNQATTSQTTEFSSRNRVTTSQVVPIGHSPLGLGPGKRKPGPCSTRNSTTKFRSEIAIEAMLRSRSAVEAARQLGVHTKTVYKWLAEVGLKPGDFEDAFDDYDEALTVHSRRTGQTFA